MICKKRKMWMFLTIFIVLCMICLSGFAILNMRMVHPSSKIENIKIPFSNKLVPYIDLHKIEQPLKLEPYQENTKGNTAGDIMATTNWVANRKSPWSSVEIRQTYYTGAINQVENHIFLRTSYYYERFPLTVDMVLEKDPFYWSFSYGKLINDERFDLCYVNINPNDAQEFSIIIVRNKQIMYVRYKGAPFTLDDLLNELDRIL